MDICCIYTATLKYALKKEIFRDRTGILLEAVSESTHYMIKAYEKDVYQIDKKLAGMVENESKISQAITNINNDHLSVLHTTIETNKRLFLVYNYSGDTLTDFINTSSHEINAQFCMKLISDIANALYSLTSNGILHRDIKPSNIFVQNKKNDNGENEYTFTLGNYTTALMLNSMQELQTVTKARIGTPRYMSPELLQCKIYDERSDIFSLGVLIYFLIYRKYPYFDLPKTLADLNQKYIRKEPIDFTQCTGEYDRVNEITKKLLTLEKDDRISINKLVVSLSG